MPKAKHQTIRIGHTTLLVPPGVKLGKLIDILGGCLELNYATRQEHRRGMCYEIKGPVEVSIEAIDADQLRDPETGGPLEPSPRRQVRALPNGQLRLMPGA